MLIKQCILLFFAIHFLTNGLLTKELAKVPFLISHYYEHKNMSSGLCFVDFLKMHYVSNLQKDPQLPFQAEKNMSLQFLFFAKNTFRIALKIIHQRTTPDKPLNINMLFAGFLKIILQPPQ